MEAAIRSLPPRSAERMIRPMQRRESLVPVGMAAALFYLLLLPEQFYPTISGLKLPPFRLFLLVAFFYLIFGSLRSRMKVVFADVLIILAAAWIWLAAYMSSGLLGTAAIMGGSHTVDIALSYFLIRMTIQSVRDFRKLLILIAPGVGIVGMIVVIEAISHRHIILPLASSITGLPNRVMLEERMGFVRGVGPFAHPIHAGIILGSFLPLYMLSGLRGWPKWMGVAASIGGVFSMSSAAMLSVVVGGALMAYDWVVERLSNLTWRLFLSFSAVLYVAVELTTQSGFYALLVRYASFNSGSAYNRVLIWRFGTENVARQPWFGLGYEDWVRPDWMHSGSFDHFWLLMALRWGVPEVVLLLGATVLGIGMVALKSRQLPPHDARLLRGVAISMGVFALGVNSVALWMSALVWFFMLLGVAVSLGAQQKEPLLTWKQS